MVCDEWHVMSVWDVICGGRVMGEWHVLSEWHVMSEWHVISGCRVLGEWNMI